MTPKLYARDREAFLAYLSDATVCEVAEERNGTYELYLEIPVASEQFPLIENDCWIKAKPSDTGDDQLFRIYGVEKSMDGLAVVQAEHVSYLLSAYPVQSVQQLDLSCQQAMNAILAEANDVLTVPHGFTAETDIDTVSNFAVSAVSARAAFGGVQGSALDTYGGEYEFDNRTVRLLRARGADRGVTIAYAKNLLGLTVNTSTESTYTGLYPFAVLEEGLKITLPEKVLQVPHPEGMAERVLLRDFTQELEGQSVTATALRNVAQSWLNVNAIGDPAVSLSVDFLSLREMSEYAEYADLERVALCDTVRIKHAGLGVEVTAKVVKTTFDALLERYTLLEIGSVRSNMSSTLASIRDEIQVLGEETTTAIEQSANAILASVATQYASGDYLASLVTQLNNSIDFRFFASDEEIAALASEVEGNQSILEEYIRFKGALIELGRVGNDFTAEFNNERLAFLENGTTIAYFGNRRLYITDAEISNSLYFEDWAIMPRSNGNLAFVYTRG